MPKKTPLAPTSKSIAYKTTSAKTATASGRAFKTKWFNREARAAGIIDEELCKAFKEVLQGQADDLGGGVWKKRINDNQHRSIILAKGKKYWIYAFLFAKKDRTNINDKELKGFKDLAKAYGSATETKIGELIDAKELVEICHDCED